LLIFVGIPLVLLNTSYFQQKIVHSLTQSLNQKTGVKLYIEESDLDLFKGFVFINVQIDDSLKHTILKAERMNVGFRILPLFRKRVELESLRIINGNIHLSRATPQSDLNIQSIINAFKKPGKSRILPWHIDFESIVMRNCRIRYDVLSVPLTQKGLDVNHLDFKEVSTKIGLKIAPKNHYQLRIYKFQAIEKGGLKIDQIKLQAKLFEEGFNLKDFELKSGASNVEIPLLDARFSSFKAFSHFADSVEIDPTTIKAKVILSDFSFINAALTNLTKPVDISIGLHGNLSDLICRKLRLNIQNMILLDGRISLKGLPNLDDLYMNGQIDMLRIFPEGVEYFSGALTNYFGRIPATRNLGIINYMGKINTVDKRWIVSGDFSTDAGNIGTNLQFSKKGVNYFYEGKIAAKDFNLKTLFPENKLLGKVSMDVLLKVLNDRVHGLSGTVEGVASHFFYNNYDFQNFALNGDFNKKGFKGTATLDDKNARLHFIGLVNLSKQSPLFNFDLMAKNVNLRALNLTQKAGNSEISFNVHSDFEGRKLDDISGRASIDSLSIYNNNEHFYLSHLNIVAGHEFGSESILISSPLLNGEIRGDYQFSTLVKSMKKLGSAYFPSLFNQDLPDYKIKNDFTFSCSLLPSKSLAGVLGLPFMWDKSVVVNGFYNDLTGKFRVKADVPDLNYGKFAVQSMGLLLENPQNEVKFLAFAQVGANENEMKMNIDTRSSNDRTTMTFNLSNASVKTYSANIQGAMQFSRRMDGQLMVDGKLNESNIILSDSLWRIHPTDVRWDNNKLFIQNFQLTHSEQFIKLQGYVSKNSSDTLSVLLNSFSLDDLFAILPKTNRNVHFGGNVSGNAKCVRLLDNPAMNADLSVENFTFNHTLMGSLKARSKWNNSMKALALEGEVRSNIEEGGVHRKIATAAGAYFPTSDSMFLSIDANRVPLGFLEPYLGKVLDRMDGMASGNVHLIGPVKKLGVYATAYAENASFGIKMLNTRYYFSDSVLVSPRIVVFRNVEVRDKEGNIAHATGRITHKYWKNVRTEIDIDAKNLLAMDLPATPNAYFYGKAYGTGKVSITGLDEKTHLDIKLRTEDKTKATISLHENTEMEDYNFIKFVQKKKVNEEFDLDLKIKKTIQTALVALPNVSINLQVDATPNAEVTLITDPNSGDEIKARGNGTIRVVYSGMEDMELYGRYTIENGSYKFVYENLLRRDFKIENGSTISFSGNPFEAELDIKANYTVNAKLSDLFSAEDLISLNLNRTSIPVNCVLKLNGELQKPGIQLDLDYPSADDDLKNQIANVINTDEMVNQQIVFLMLFGRFSTPTYTMSTQQQSTSNLSTALNTTFSTVSSQLNNMINDVFGKSILSFDFDYQNAAYELGTPGEWKVGMSGQWLDNRLTFNGNLGSRENLVQSNKSQFIGEFDMNIKFKNSAKWSARIYNKANDNRYFKSALNTQGIGIVYKEEFNKLSDLFRQMLENVRRPFRKKEKPAI